MIEPPVLGFAGYATVPAPRDGFWRVSSWSQVFDPPPPPQPLGASPAQDDSGRYDDPAGRFRTLYCATEPEGALGEHLGDFVLSTAAVVRIEAFLDSEPEPGFDEDYHRQLRAEDIKAFGWKLGRAPAREARLIDVEHWRTYLAAAPRAMPALGRYGIERFDRRTLLDERRYITRTLAGVYRVDATNERGQLRASGLRFTSRLPPAWECWALWEPLPLEEAAAEIEDVTFNTPALRTTADMLGVASHRRTSRFSATPSQ
jgi:RES domain